MFQLGVPMCQMTCRFFKHSSYEMLREISILYHYKNILHYTWHYSYTLSMWCIAHENCIRLHFYTSCHIKERCLDFFFFFIAFFFFCSLCKVKIHLDMSEIKAKKRYTLVFGNVGDEKNVHPGGRKFISCTPSSGDIFLCFFCILVFACLFVCFWN